MTRGSSSVPTTVLPMPTTAASRRRPPLDPVPQPRHAHGLRVPRRPRCTGRGVPRDRDFGVRQLDGAGGLEPSMRRFPHPVRWLFEALGSERWPIRSSWLGGRVLDPEPYEHPTRCDWTSGSAMLARADVVRQLGGMDESLFFYFEEPDLCLRARDAGWATMHLPSLTIVHYGGNQGVERERWALRWRTRNGSTCGSTCRGSGDPGDRSARDGVHAARRGRPQARSGGP